MTSNQLQYQSNKIQQQIADETERHNNAVESEQLFRDEYEKQYKEKSAEISQQVADETERHNREMEEIQRRYNELYLEMQSANNDRQNEIRAELAELEKRKTDIEEEYKTNLASLEAEKNAIDQQKVVEMKRSNLASESIQRDINDLKERQLDLENRIADNQAMYWSGQIQNDIMRNNIQMQANQNSWNLGLYNTQLGMYDLQQRMLEWKTKKENIEAETFRTLLNGLTSSIADVTKSAANVLGTLSFIPQSNIPKFKLSGGK